MGRAARASGDVYREIANPTDAVALIAAEQDVDVQLVYEQYDALDAYLQQQAPLPVRPLGVSLEDFAQYCARSSVVPCEQQTAVRHRLYEIHGSMPTRLKVGDFQLFAISSGTSGLLETTTGCHLGIAFPDPEALARSMLRSKRESFGRLSDEKKDALVALCGAWLLELETMRDTAWNAAYLLASERLDLGTWEANVAAVLAWQTESGAFPEPVLGQTRVAIGVMHFGDDAILDQLIFERDGLEMEVGDHITRILRECGR